MKKNIVFLLCLALVTNHVCLAMFALHQAVKQGNSEQVTIYLDEFNINQLDNDGNTPLHLAATVGHIEIAQLLVKSGALVNQPNKQNRTPLHMAADAGQQAIVQLLLENGACFKKKDRQMLTPLDLAKSNIATITAQNFMPSPRHNALLMLTEGDQIFYQKNTEKYKNVARLLEEWSYRFQNMRAAQLTFCSGLSQKLGENSNLKLLDHATILRIANLLKPTDFPATLPLWFKRSSSEGMFSFSWDLLKFLCCGSAEE